MPNFLLILPWHYYGLFLSRESCSTLAWFFLFELRMKALELSTYYNRHLLELSLTNGYYFRLFLILCQMQSFFRLGRYICPAAGESVRNSLIRKWMKNHKHVVLSIFSHALEPHIVTKKTNILYSITTKHERPWAQPIAHDRSKEFHWKFNPPVAAKMIQLQNPLLRFLKTTKGNFSVEDF